MIKFKPRKYFSCCQLEFLSPSVFCKNWHFSPLPALNCAAAWAAVEQLSRSVPTQRWLWAPNGKAAAVVSSVGGAGRAGVAQIPQISCHATNSQEEAPSQCPPEAGTAAALFIRHPCHHRHQKNNDHLRRVHHVSSAVPNTSYSPSHFFQQSDEVIYNYSVLQTRNGSLHIVCGYPKSHWTVLFWLVDASSTLSLLFIYFNEKYRVFIRYFVQSWYDQMVQKFINVYFFLIYIFLAEPGLSCHSRSTSLTRDGTRAPCVGSAES